MAKSEPRVLIPDYAWSGTVVPRRRGLRLQVAGALVLVGAVVGAIILFL